MNTIFASRAITTTSEGDLCGSGGRMNFQTPTWVCDMIVAEIPKLIERPDTILEPTAGEGNLVRAIHKRYPSTTIHTPTDFFEFDEHVDVVVGNPPFSPMRVGYDILERCFGLSNNIIMLMPWLSVINSEKRTEMYRDQGLCKVIHLPRRAFSGSRVQTCVLVFQYAHNGEIEIVL